MNVLLIHFSEITLKGRNRSFFENKLAVNIGRALKDLNVENMKTFGGGFLIFIKDAGKIDKYIERLSTIPGIANFLPVYESEKNYDVLEKAVLKNFPQKEFETFKIDTRRTNKDFDLNSQDINKRLGKDVKDKIKIKVDLEKPELSVYVDVHKDKIYFGFEKFEGVHGLPVDSSGTVVSLMSGGLDSPVASQMMMKRGCRVIFIHFHAHPYVSAASKEKAGELVTVLDKYQHDSRLYMVAFGDIQKKVTISVPAPYRVVVYRRLMLRIGAEIARREKASGLVTGESVGQVASQTIENITTVGRATDMLILRPLLGMDKEEIVRRAKDIGTYDISIRPDEDCCTLFVPKHPATKTKEKGILKIEENLDIKKLVEEALKNAEIKTF